jgi:predicted anti-sigma-YlaC factor YlaD
LSQHPKSDFFEGECQNHPARRLLPHLTLAAMRRQIITPATSLASTYQAIGAKRSIRATATEAAAAIDAAWQHSQPPRGRAWGGYRVDVAGVGFFIPEWTVYGVTLLSRLVRQPLGAVRDAGNSRRGDVAQFASNAWRAMGS